MVATDLFLYYLLIVASWSVQPSGHNSPMPSKDNHIDTRTYGHLQTSSVLCQSRLTLSTQAWNLAIRTLYCPWSLVQMVLAVRKTGNSINLLAPQKKTSLPCSPSTITYCNAYI